MSNAGRPTFTPARGSTTQGGSKLFAQSHGYSSRDLPSHKTLKTRQPGQNTKEEIAARDLKNELDNKEKKKSEKDKPTPAASEASSPPLALEEAPSSPAPDTDKKRKADDLANAADADDVSSSSSDSDDDAKKTNGGGGADDDEDEEAELMRELEKIKKERAEEAERKAREEADRRAHAMVNSNPLLGNVAGSAAPAGDFTIKKKWYEDTVFRNQAKDEPEKKKRFINDTTRNDFHRRFLDKYIT